MMGYTGRYSPQYPAKYIGDPTRIFYRSAWERQCMKFFDLQSNVLAWQSEELCVPYADPMTGRPRRYFPDFLIKVKRTDGGTETLLVEIKPYVQTQAPVPTATNKPTKRYLRECYTFAKNQAKWRSAKALALSKGWQFVVWTEKDLPFI